MEQHSIREMERGEYDFWAKYMCSCGHYMDSDKEVIAHKVEILWKERDK